MKSLICIFLLIGLNVVSAQNEVHKKAADKFMQQFNNNDFEGIYESFSPSMKQSRAKEYFLSFFTKLKKNNGNLLQLELLEYNENKVRTSRGIYDGDFETGLSTVRITVDIRGKITGLLFKRKNLI